MSDGLGRGSGFLPRPPVVKHTSTAASRADDVKRRAAVYREGFIDRRRDEIDWRFVGDRIASDRKAPEPYRQLYPGGYPGWWIGPHK